MIDIDTYSIETRNLTKRFVIPKGISELVHQPFKKNGEVTSVEDVNLTVQRGEIFGILGPNGAGKTTLIKILCTLILPTSGHAYVNGYDVVEESGKVRESLGYVTTDERSFYWRLTGRQNLEFFATLHNYTANDAKERIDQLLTTIDLKDRADDRFSSYSAGMKQKMAIVRGLLNDPEVLFMDEPTRSLDPGAAQNLREFVKEHIVKEKGKSIFLSTHHLGEAEQLCDTVAIIDEGQIRIIGSPEELKNNLGDNSTLDDVFTHYTGKTFRHEHPSQTFISERHFKHGRGFGFGRRRF